MNVKEWVTKLAVAYDHKVTAALLIEYQEILGEWSLSDEAWAHLKREAKLRHDFFPRISQLNEIRQEMLQSARYREKPGDEPSIELVTIDGVRYGRPRRRNGGAA